MFDQMPLPSEDSRYFGTENATEIIMRKRIPIIKGESERLERRGRRRQKNIGLSLPTSKDRREFFTTLNHVRWNTDQSGFGPKHETQHPDPQRNTTDVKQMASVKQQFIDSTVCIFFFCYLHNFVSGQNKRLKFSNNPEPPTDHRNVSCDLSLPRKLLARMRHKTVTL